MSKNVAEQLVEMLVDAGVKRIYAVTGDSLNPVNEAVRRDKRIDWVHVRHEEVGAYAAGAEAQLTGLLTCCAGSSGPGHVHLVNGLYDSHRSGDPVLAIASTCVSNEFGMEYHQETDPKKLFDDCSLYNQVAFTPAQFPRMLQSAMQQATQRKGVAVIGLPGDLAAATSAKSASSSKIYSPHPIVRPSDEEIQQLAEIINEGGKVTIYGGYGCRGAHAEVLALAEKINAPVAYSYRGKMELEYDNPNAVGLTGLLGHTSGYEAMHNADVLLLLGTDFPYDHFMPKKNKIVQIDIKSERLGRRAPLDLGLQGNIKETLQALLPLVEERTDNHFLKMHQIMYKKTVKHLNENVDTKRGKKDRIHPEYVAASISKLANDNAVFAVDTGMCCVWGARFVKATKDREMLGSFVHGSMANAMPQAIGAQLAFPKRQVIAFCGDGGISMLLGDLMTISQYKLPIKLFVFNNRSLGMVKLEMQVEGIEDWQTDMVNPDFAQLAESMNIKGMTIDTPEDVEDGIAEALAHDGPVVVNVKTDPSALALPPHIEWKQMKGFATSMTKMVVDGKLKDVIETIKSNSNHLDDFL